MNLRDPKTQKFGIGDDVRTPLPPLMRELTKILNEDTSQVTDEDAVRFMSSFQELRSKVAKRLSIWDIIMPFGIITKTAGSLIGCSMISWFFGWLGFSPWPVLVMLTLISSMWEKTLARHYLHIREQVARELVQVHDDKVTESVDWLNEIISKYWVLVEPKISADICANLQAALDKNKPSVLSDLTLSHFTLGSHAPRVQFVRTFTRLGQDVVRMFTHVSFTPLQKYDVVASQVRKEEEKRNVNANLDEYVDHDYKNARIRVDARIAGVNVPIEVNSVGVELNLMVRVKLSPDFPHIHSVRLYAPIELMPPSIDFALKPLGILDVTTLPIISPLLKSQTEGALQRLLHEPGYLIEFGKKSPGFSSDWTAFVLRARVIDAHSLRNKGSSLLGSVSDPYCKLTLSGGEVARTSSLRDTLHPVWDQTLFVPIPAHALSSPRKSDLLTFSIFDKNQVEKDQHMGSTVPLPLADWLHFGLDDWRMTPEHTSLAKSFGFPHLVQNPTNADLYSTDGKEKRGSIRIELSAASVSKRAYDPTVIGPPSGGGVVRVTCLQATGLGGGALAKPVSSYLAAYLDQKLTWRSNVRASTNQPIYMTFFDIYVPNVDISVVSVEVHDKGALGKDTLLGRVDIRLRQVLAKKGSDDWYRISGTNARLRLRFQLFQVRFGANWAKMEWQGREEPDLEAVEAESWPEDDPSHTLSVGLARSGTRVLSPESATLYVAPAPTSQSSPISPSPTQSSPAQASPAQSPTLSNSASPDASISTLGRDSTMSRRIIVARPIKP
jgi:Ca2+-dependent lipid-binding protein